MLPGLILHDTLHHYNYQYAIQSRSEAIQNFSVLIIDKKVHVAQITQRKFTIEIRFLVSELSGFRADCLMCWIYGKCV